MWRFLIAVATCLGVTATANAQTVTKYSGIQPIEHPSSYAEKYFGESKVISIEFQSRPGLEIRVLDRGLGVPHGCEKKIFEQFYRAHDSLASGIQGSGLGLTLARQIARSHGGDVVYEAREGGGSCFILKLP